MKCLYSLCLLTLCATVAACQPSTPSAAQAAPVGQPVAQTTSGSTTEPAGAASPTTSVVEATLDNVHKGMAYADFRTALLADGWRPVVDLRCKANVVGAAYKDLCAKGSDSCKACNELPELSACSGDAVCMMRFRDADTRRQLEVSTYGDIRDRAAHGTDSQLNVTGWTVSSPASH